MDNNNFNPVLVLTQKLSAYPPEKRNHLINVIFPGILMDFHKMLTKSAEGKEVSEEYRLDDGSMSILLSGIKEKGIARITSADIMKA